MSSETYIEASQIGQALAVQQAAKAQDIAARAVLSEIQRALAFLLGEAASPATA